MRVLVLLLFLAAPLQAQTDSLRARDSLQAILDERPVAEPLSVPKLVGYSLLTAGMGAGIFALMVNEDGYWTRGEFAAIGGAIG